MATLQGTIEKLESNESTVKRATQLADTIDKALGIQPEENGDPIVRLNHQISGLVGALKEAKEQTRKAKQ